MWGGGPKVDRHSTVPWGFHVRPNELRSCSLLTIQFPCVKSYYLALIYFKLCIIILINLSSLNESGGQQVLGGIIG